jgi:hypothetical protein
MASRLELRVPVLSAFPPTTHLPTTNVATREKFPLLATAIGGRFWGAAGFHSAAITSDDRPPDHNSRRID